MTSDTPSTLGELRAAVTAAASLAVRSATKSARTSIARLRAGETLFPGIIGYDDTVVPQIVNAILSRHNFILLGLRGQAKSRILRALDRSARRRRSRSCRAARSTTIRWRRSARRAAPGSAQEGDDLPIAWLGRDARYVEKLATPDVTIADMIGDIDPIKAARAGLQLSDELTMHYGLLPRANRGIFAINELPDLAGKIQVGLFNILQEGDVQIKGYPVRLPLDVMLVVHRQPRGLHGARQDHHAAQGPHRLGDPHALPGDAPARDGDHRAGSVGRARRGCELHGARVRPRGRRGGRVPGARRTRRSTSAPASASGCRSRCSRTSSRTPSAARCSPAKTSIVPRVTDIYAALPAITGKFELEYEGELRGADNVARDLIRAAVGNVFNGYFAGADLRQVIEWFDLGGSLQIDDTLSAAELLRAHAPRCRGCAS